jgi:ParB family chromosome partitioning protein
MAKKDFSILQNKISTSLQRNATSILDRAEKVADTMPSPLSVSPAPESTVTFTRESNAMIEQTVDTTKSETFTRESSLNKDDNVVQAKSEGFTRESGGYKKAPYFKRVDYDLIEPNPFNARQTYLPQKVNKMAIEISADGQLTPGVATIRNGKYVLAAGHYRWKGIGVAKIGFMDLMIHEDISDQELYKLSFKENEERNGQSALDNALAWKLLLDKNLYENETQISEVTGLSLPNINKTMSILNLPERVLIYIKEQDVNNFGLSPLYELVQYSKVASEQETFNMAEKIITDGYGRDQIAEARKLRQAPKVRKQKEMANNYKLPNNGYIKEFGSGKVVFEANITDPEVRRQLIEELKNRFQ